MMEATNTDLNTKPCIGILREVKSPWERRVALTPTGCKELLALGVRILVQPSKTRCFSEDEYVEVGCEVKEDLNECNLIVGLQDTDVNCLLQEKTYSMFSHCKKGKTDNRGLLEKMLEKNIRLIDYECIKEDKENRAEAKRLVSFGKMAGIAGTINLFKGIGELLLARQVATPFVFTKLAYMYPSVEDGENSLKTLGSYLKEQFLPREYSPFTIAVLGKGRVSVGVQEALKCLPHKFLTPEELLADNFEKRRDMIYVVVFGAADLYEKMGDSKEAFDKAEFMKSPENYTSNFDSKYLPYFHAIINCLYWESRHPRILSKTQLKNHVAKNDTKLIAISDISCDINGAIEILKEYTSFRKPFFVYEPVEEKEIDHVDKASKEGIICTAIPNLAASFSIDASECFCHLLVPYLKNLAFSKYPEKFENQTDLLPELRNACICSNGVLTPRYRNIFRNTEEKQRFEINLSEQDDRPFFLSLKVKGFLFDSGFFHLIVDNIGNQNLAHKINFLSIGEGPDQPSILYFEVFGQTKEELVAFFNLVKEKVEPMKLEYSVIKSNIL